jgi:Arc/MetJ-type ribon-helix-helix transcriptional regulator
MRRDKVCRISLNLTEGIVDLAYRAITGGRYSSVSEYVRALIVNERRRSGDIEWSRVNPRVPMGRPRKAA